MNFVKLFAIFVAAKHADGHQQILNVTKPIVTACFDKSSTVYFGLIGYTLQSSSNAINISIEREDQCISACTDQTSPYERNIAVNCSSLTLTSDSTFPCVLHTESAVPDGNLAIKKDNKSVLLQKFCLPGNALSYCFEQIFNLFVGMSFDKSAAKNRIRSSKQNTLAECAAKCVLENCKAGEFDDELNLCSFYNDTSRDYPLPIKGKKDQYFFENGCLRGSKSKNITSVL